MGGGLALGHHLSRYKASFPCFGQYASLKARPGVTPLSEIGGAPEAPFVAFAVGTLISERPTHRTGRARWRDGGRRFRRVFIYALQSHDRSIGASCSRGRRKTDSCFRQCRIAVEEACGSTSLYRSLAEPSFSGDCRWSIGARKPAGRIDGRPVGRKRPKADKS